MEHASSPENRSPVIDTSPDAPTHRPPVVSAEDIRTTGSRTLRFEGGQHGSSVSFFDVSNDPGQGPGLHRHPYDETWHVLEGRASVVVGEQRFTVRAGDTAVAPASVWHRFTNTGDGVLRILCVHASPVIVQEDADDPGQP